MKRFSFFSLFFSVIFALSGTSFAQIAPAVPQSPVAAPISACGVELQWNQSDSADSFDVRINGGLWSKLAISGGTGSISFLRTAKDSSLRPEQTTTYQIRACNNIGGCSEGSSIISATTPAVPAAPALPTHLRTEGWMSNGSQVILSWLFSETSATKGIRVYRSDEVNGSNPVPVATTRSTYRANELQPTWSDPVSTNDPHAYRIKTYSTDLHCPAVNDITPTDAYWVKFSGSFSEALTIPKRPATVEVKATQENNSKAAFKWENVQNETGYVFQIWQAGTATPGDSVTQTHGANDTDTNFYPLNGSFNYRVKACNITGNNIGCSDFRNPIAPFSSGLVPPQNVRADVASLNFGAGTAAISLTWDDNASYNREIRIYRKIAGDASFPATPRKTLGAEEVSCAESSPLTCSTTDTADLGSDYEYHVRFKELPNGPEIASLEIPRVNLDLEPINGLGWSSAIGWISMNSETVGPGNKKHIEHSQPGKSAVPYGVYRDSDGLVGGQAWVENYGYITFVPKYLEGCPDGTTELCRAKIVEENGKFFLRGWGRFWSAQSGSWHGWVSFGEKKLNGTTRVAFGLEGETISWWNPDFLGVKMRNALEKPTAGFASLLNTFKTWIASAQTIDGSREVVEFKKSQGTLSGQAWGGDLVGWIGFGCGENYGVSCNQPPVVSNVTVNLLSASEGWCAPTPTYVIQWNYGDPDGDAQKKAEINFRKVSNGAISATRTLTTPSSVPNQQYNLGDPLGYNAGMLAGYTDYPYNRPNFLARDTAYYAEVTVWDSAENNSLATSANFKTPEYYSPLADFATPDGIKSAPAATTFVDESKSRLPEGAHSLALTRAWTFDGGIPTSSIASQVEVVLGSLTKTTLSATDVLGNQCITEQSFSRGSASSTKRRVFIER